MTDINELIETELEKGRTKGAKDKKKRKSLGDRIKSAFSTKEKAKDHPGSPTRPPENADVQLKALKRAQKRRR